jgi:hypothetical protein
MIGSCSAAQRSNEAQPCVQEVASDHAHPMPTSYQMNSHDEPAAQLSSAQLIMQTRKNQTMYAPGNAAAQLCGLQSISFLILATVDSQINGPV